MNRGDEGRKPLCPATGAGERRMRSRPGSYLTKCHLYLSK